jgi:hypothetical protein
VASWQVVRLRRVEIDDTDQVVHIGCKRTSLQTLWVAKFVTWFGNLDVLVYRLSKTVCVYYHIARAYMGS